MSDFDKTTEYGAEAYASGRDANGKYQLDVEGARLDFTAGRESCRESLCVMAKALKEVSAVYAAGGTDFRHGLSQADHDKILVAIDAVKASGDWPLGEE